MPSKPSEPSVTYEDIVRRTVPDPGGSPRPSVAAEQAALTAASLVDAEQSVIRDRVREIVDQLAAGAIEVEVDGDAVTLRGRIADPAILARLEDAVARIDGVRTVANRIVVTAS